MGPKKREIRLYDAVGNIFKKKNPYRGTWVVQ